MADQKKISALPLASEVRDNDVFVGNQDGVTKRMAAGSLRAYALAALGAVTDPDKGAQLVGWDGSTVGEQMDLSKKLSSYAALRAYTGSATRFEITRSGIDGKFVKRAFVSGDTDDGGILLVSDDGLYAYERQFVGITYASWFDDGTTTVYEALQRACNSALIVSLEGKAYSIPYDKALSLRAGAQLIGAGKKKTRLETPIINFASGIPLIIPNGDNILVRGIDLGGGRAISNESTSNTGRFSVIGYPSSQYDGLVFEDCIIRDCRGKAAHFTHHNTKFYKVDFLRTGIFIIDIASMNGAISNWATGLSSDGLDIVGCTFTDIGGLNTSVRDVSNVMVLRNKSTNVSAIGFGFQGCTDIEVRKNRLKYTFNSGIDLQQCANQRVKDNNLTYCGYGDVSYLDGVTPRTYQAIYAGDDSSSNSSGTSLSVDLWILDNNITGGYVSGGAETVTRDQCTGGIHLVSLNNAEVAGNKIRGIGSRKSTALLAGMTNKDGVGIKHSNKCYGLNIHDNPTSHTKNDGIFVGIGDLQDLSLINNRVTYFGRNGISVSATSSASGLTINENKVSLGANSQGGTVKSMSLGISGGYILDLIVQANTLVGNSLVSYGLYFDKTGSTAGLGVCSVRDNLIHGHSANDIAFSDVFIIGPKAPLYNAFSNNRNLSGIIYQIPNLPDIAIEFVADAAPTTGTFAKGSICRYPFPNSGGFIGSVCTLSGSPGSWKQYGQIAA